MVDDVGCPGIVHGAANRYTATMEHPQLAVAAPHILVVNDDPDVLDLLADLFTGEGYRVTTSMIAYESPAEVAALAPDVLIADLRLGWTLEEGMGFLDRLHADPLTAEIPVIVCSASHPEVMAEAGARLKAQACALVGKPFDVDDLLDAVSTCLCRVPRLAAVLGPL
jgi:CheY-like chemotaxis protein